MILPQNLRNRTGSAPVFAGTFGAHSVMILSNAESVG
jgi:hypothetical protein